jgi:cytochrome c556
MKLKRTLFSMLAAGVLVTSAGVAVADENAITYRKSVMKAVGGHMKAISMIVKGEAGDMKDIAAHASSMAGLAKATATAFPEGSGPMDGKTEALPDVWEKPDDFKQVTMAFIAETEKLAAAAQGGDKGAIGAQLGMVGKNGCKACHDNFREKK